jgi:hypothetical protein
MTVNLLTCEVLEEWEEDVCCDLSNVHRASWETSECGSSPGDNGLGTDCCLDEYVGTFSPGTAHEHYLVKFTTFDLADCSSTTVCHPLRDCEIYSVLGGSCWYSATGDPNADPAAGLPVFPVSGLYLSPGAPWEAVNVTSALGANPGSGNAQIKDVLAMFGLTPQFLMEYIGNTGSQIDVAQRGPYTEEYRYTYFDNWDPVNWDSRNGVGYGVLNPALPGLCVIAYFLANQPYTYSGTGTGTFGDATGSFAGCQAMCYIGVNLPGVSPFFFDPYVYTLRVFGGPYSGAASGFDYSKYTFYTDQIRMDFGVLLWSLYPTYSSSGYTDFLFDGVAVYDFDVPPLRSTNFDPVDFPDTLTAIVSTLGAPYDGTYTLTYQYGLWSGTNGNVHAAFYPAIAGTLLDPVGSPIGGLTSPQTYFGLFTDSTSSSHTRGFGWYTFRSLTAGIMTSSPVYWEGELTGTPGVLAVIVQE